MTMITPSYLGETIEYSSLHACRSTLEDPTYRQAHGLISSDREPQSSARPDEQAPSPPRDRKRCLPLILLAPA